jgi:catechol 2,3-dioxygenase-like lactoylglutathione lyase family enzyme
MAAWYEKHLHMRVVRKVDEGPFTRFIADQSGRVVLELFHQNAPVPDYRSMDPMVLHVAFVSADIKKDWAALLAAGGSPAIEPKTSPDGDEMAFLRDPWGVCIQLVKRGKPLLG